MIKLPGDYISGFVDGEGCFSLIRNLEHKYQRGGKPCNWSGYRWILKFGITIREDDKEILEKIKGTLGCGKINFSRGSAQFFVNDFKDLWYKVIPFFDKHQLRAKKRLDYLLWKEAAGILFRKFKIPTKPFVSKKLTIGEEKRLFEILEEMKKYKSK